MANWTVKGADDKVMLGTAEIGSEDPTEPVPLRITNTSNWSMTAVSVGALGEGRSMIQFAADNQGQPGVWAAAGEAVTPGVRVDPDQSFVVWARVYAPDEGADPGIVNFNIKIEGFAGG